MSTAYPITGVSGTEVHHRLELRDLAKSPIQWSLFIQAMTNLLNMSDSTQPNSWWQMGSIHGLPYTPWSGDPNGPQQADSDSGWGGYCYHAAALFPPWHRVLLLLVEQAVVNEAISIASGLDNDEWLAAARSLRFPFWDWTREETVEEGLPVLCRMTQVPITYADGLTAMVDNPLNHYTYTGEPGAAKGAPYMATWTRTYRWANSDLNPTEEEYEQAREAFGSVTPLTVGTSSYNLMPLTWLRAKVAQLFRYDLTVPESGYGANIWGFFSNTGNKYEKIRSALMPSIEEPHNQVHLHTGGNGSMSLNEYAGFDPIFFLHHCNVDRIYAFWEYVYPEYWIGSGWLNPLTGQTVPFVTDSGTFNQDSGAVISQDTELHPFRNAALNYWTAEEARSLLSTSSVNKNYTYPPIASPITGEEVDVRVPYDTTDVVLRARYRWILHNEWSPGLLNTFEQHRALSRLFPKLSQHVNILFKEENQVTSLRQFFLVGQVPEFAFPGSYRLELYLPNNTNASTVNSVSVLGRADPERCAACRGRLAAGSQTRGDMPLDPALILHLFGKLSPIELPTIGGVDDVAALINKRLGARLVKPDGTVIAVAETSLPPGHAPMDDSKVPKVTIHSHVIRVNNANVSAGIDFVDHADHGAFGAGLQWREV